MIEQFNKRKKIILAEITLFFVAFFLPALIWTDITNIHEISLPYILQYETITIPQIALMLYILAIQQLIATSNREETVQAFKFVSEGLKRFGIVKFKVRYFVKIFLIVLLLLLFSFTVSLILSLIPQIGEEIIEQKFKTPDKSYSQLILIFVFSITVGYWEELFFRAYLLNRFEDIGISQKVSILLSSLLFSIGHLYEGYMGVMITFFIGLYLAHTFLKFRNLHINAIAHCLYNFAILSITILIK